MSALLREYLTSSSIHGLEYLANVRSTQDGSLAKIGWFLCVSTSFMAAATLIYMNILNWDNSPVIVSDTRPIQLKYGDVPMPMFMVCPRRLSFRNLVENYINANEAAMTADMSLDAVMKSSGVESDIAERISTQLTFARRYGLHNPFRDACTDKKNTASSNVSNGADSNENSKECEFYKFLNSLGSVEGTEQLQTCLDESVQGYIVTTGLTGEEPSVAGMEEFMHSACGFKKPPESARTFPETTAKAEEILRRFYLPFFPVFTETLTHVEGLSWWFWPTSLSDNHLEKAHALEDFDLTAQINGEQSNSSGEFKLGTTLGYMLDGNMGGAKDHVFNRVFQGLADDLQVSSGIEAVDLLSMFAYGDEFFFGKVGPSDREPLGNCQPKICRGNHSGHFSCAKYCQFLTKGREFSDQILKIYEMATESFGELAPNKSRSILPSCSWNKGLDTKCWTRVATDQGTCYTNYNKGWRLGKQLSMDHPLNFSFEVLAKDQVEGPSTTSEAGRKWAVPSYHEFAVFLSPSGHFASQSKLLSKSSMHIMDYGNDEITYVNSQLFVRFNYLVRTTPEFRTMSPERRQCYFPDERELDFFPEYSEANCVLECSWKRAADKCECVPWFLKTHFPGQYMCEIWGNECFKAIVDGRYDFKAHGCSEQCPQNCESQEFEVYDTKTTVVSEGLHSFYCFLTDHPACPRARARQNNTEKVVGKSKSA